MKDLKQMVDTLVIFFFVIEFGELLFLNWIFFKGLFEWILNINNGRQQAWSTLIARDMLDQGLDFNSAVKVLSSTPLIAPLYYIMAGPNNLQVYLNPIIFFNSTIVV